jgi:hypothetical protein
MYFLPILEISKSMAQNQPFSKAIRHPQEWQLLLEFLNFHKVNIQVPFFAACFSFSYFNHEGKKSEAMREHFAYKWHKSFPIFYCLFLHATFLQS